MQEPPRDNGGRGSSDPTESARLTAAMRSRGWLTVVFVTMAISQMLTVAFTFITQQIDAAPAEMSTLVFGCMTSVLVSYWLVADARKAWREANGGGYIGPAHAINDDDVLKVANNCPKRWLVVLHIELNAERAASG
jgi:hypothetical protein